ncbi:Colicin-Ia [Shigella sonnei]|nr:Colicin-Ia [Shigella sonnei]SRR46743.1 Colicin-Ia [Shigella sonnei]
MSDPVRITNPGAESLGYDAYSALFDHGLASKSDQRFASIRSTGNLTFSTAF